MRQSIDWNMSKVPVTLCGRDVEREARWREWLAALAEYDMTGDESALARAKAVMG